MATVNECQFRQRSKATRTRSFSFPRFLTYTLGPMVIVAALQMPLSFSTHLL